VRLSVALEARLDGEIQARVDAAAVAQAAADAEDAADPVRRGWRTRGYVHREVVRGVMEKTIVGEARERDESYDAASRLSALRERLDLDDECAEFADHTIGEMIEQLCRELGVTHDPSLWRDPPPDEINPRLAELGWKRPPTAGQARAGPRPWTPDGRYSSPH
jgi:hypothetical protein